MGTLWGWRLCARRHSWRHRALRKWPCGGVHWRSKAGPILPGVCEGFAAAVVVFSSASLCSGGGLRWASGRLDEWRVESSRRSRVAWSKFANATGVWPVMHVPCTFKIENLRGIRGYGREQSSCVRIQCFRKGEGGRKPARSSRTNAALSALPFLLEMPCQPPHASRYNALITSLMLWGSCTPPLPAGHRSWIFHPKTLKGDDTKSMLCPPSSLAASQRDGYGNCVKRCCHLLPMPIALLERLNRVIFSSSVTLQPLSAAHLT